MPSGWVGTTGSNRKEIVQIRVGTPTGTRNVVEGWVGTPNGNKKWFMQTNNLVATAFAQSTSQILIQWNVAHPSMTYTVTRLPSTVLQSSSFTTYVYDSNLAADTIYNYRVDGIRNGVIFDTATVSAKTAANPPPPPPPPPPTYRDEQRVWSAYPVQIASYNGSNVQRSWSGSNGNQPACYYGGFSGSAQGEQKSQVRWAIPGEIRGCLSVDRVELHWPNIHTWNIAGGNVSMVAHHNGDITRYGGNTGPLLDNGNQVRWPTRRAGLINNTDWYDLAWLTSAGRPSIAEEIRVQGMQGFGLIRALSGDAGYGYAVTNPILRITYTVRVQV